MGDPDSGRGAGSVLAGYENASQHERMEPENQPVRVHRTFYADVRSRYVGNRQRNDDGN